MLQFEIRGMKKLRQVLDGAPEEILKVAQKTMHDVANQIKNDAQRLCPVKTGYLRSTIYYRTTAPLRISFGATAPYAYFVEYGTSRMFQRPFLRIALQNNQGEFVPTFNKLILEYFRGI